MPSAHKKTTKHKFEVVLRAYQQHTWVELGTIMLGLGGGVGPSVGYETPHKKQRILGLLLKKFIKSDLCKH